MKGKGSKTMNCRECNEPVDGVGIDSTAVTCWKCVNASLRSNLVIKEDEEENGNKDKKHSSASE